MKKKNSKRDNVNLFFSAFLMLAYIVCGYFFMQFAASMEIEALKNAITAAILVIFGLLVFYATRVGEGKAIKRFSILTLLILDLPALYIIVASIFEQVPLHEQIHTAPLVAYMAAVALGYGIPYTFLSGFESYYEDAQPEQNTEEENVVLEGGVEADLDDAEDNFEEEAIDEIVVEGSASEDEAENIEEETEE